MKKILILVVLGIILTVSVFASHGRGGGHHGYGGGYGHYHGNVWCEQSGHYHGNEWCEIRHY